MHGPPLQGDGTPLRAARTNRCPSLIFRMRQAIARRRLRCFPEPGALSTHTIQSAGPLRPATPLFRSFLFRHSPPSRSVPFCAMTVADLQHSSDEIFMPESFQPKFDDKALLTAVCVDEADGAVLMVAFMDAEALAETRATGFAHFHSRSRGRLWKKGETSGHVLEVVETLVDCDQDALVLRCRPAGPACHTGARTCFFRKLEGDTLNHRD